MMNARLVLLPGDGVGQEVTSAARLVLQRVAEVFRHSFDFQTHLSGGAALRATGVPLPEETLAASLDADGILLGAVGHPDFDAHAPHQRPEAALLQIRQQLGLYANLRPARVWKGLEAAGPLKPEVLANTDVLVVRELTGGLYYGEPRGLSPEGDSTWNTMRYSRAEVTRIARVAFDAAKNRRRHVTSVDKANVLETSRLWRAVVNTVARDYPDVRVEHMYVDSCAMRLTLAPASFDVVLTENLFGDILSDEAGAVVGSLGLLPSASLGDKTGLFEPVHGSAPDIAGLNAANPIGAILSGAMLLRHALKLETEASAVEAAVERTIADGRRTRDIGGTSSCSEMAKAIAERIQM
jgi:3-isopropylmalate dehydrogenase